MGRWRIFKDPDQGDLFEGEGGNVDEMRRKGSGAGKRKAGDKVKRGRRLSDWDLRMARLKWGHNITEAEAAKRLDEARKASHAWLDKFRARVHGDGVSCETQGEHTDGFTPF